MYKGRIPFDAKTGDQLSYVPNAWRNDQGIDWRPNDPFDAVIELTGMERGRSAAHFTVKSGDRYYTMFMIDLMDLLCKCGIVRGKTELLQWCFCKRGQHYGITLYDSLGSH